jgi:hypothetical protein
LVAKSAIFLRYFIHLETFEKEKKEETSDFYQRASTWRFGAEQQSGGRPGSPNNFSG